ncbi:hypothetical protein [Arthrobacter psychrochitiniphilus]|uniref:hypothetical protein n=1 Tax=Arthrobacter psychrochitiniphilus TaxID=291045 RepID=UPI003F7C977F
MRSSVICTTVAILMSSVLLASAGVADESEGKSWWDDDGVQTEVLLPTPGGDYVRSPVADAAADPFIYDPRVACTDGDIVLFPECASIMPACASGIDAGDGKPGTVIYWYRAERSRSPLMWHYFRGPECIFGEKPRDLLAEIAGQIAHEFQRTPIAAAEFGSQPGPHTLRGKETNVWAAAKTQTFNLSMLGQNVTITATPAGYTWDYGDGTTWGPTPIHGAPLHADRIGEQTQTSHVYTETGRLTIGLTTHFNGSYSVNGGPELPIPGQGNIASPALPLTVWRSETHLYADDCIVNPHGVGC